MLVLRGKQGQRLPARSNGAPLDHAYPGHAGTVAAFLPDS